MLTRQEIEAKLKEDDEFWQDCLSRVGRENVYSCQKCRSYIVTVDRDPGVNPMFISHRLIGEITKSKQTCDDTLVSHNYPDPATKPDFIHDATLEWVRQEYYSGLTPEQEEYVRKGGLDLQVIVDRD